MYQSLWNCVPEKWHDYCHSKFSFRMVSFTVKSITVKKLVNVFEKKGHLFIEQTWSEVNFSFVCLSTWMVLDNAMLSYSSELFSKHVIQLRFDNIIHSIEPECCRTLSFAINLLLSPWNQANKTIEKENLLCFL